MPHEETYSELCDRCGDNDSTPKNTGVHEILKDFDPPSQNSSREIIKHWLDKFHNCPCDFHAKKLESFGIAVDFDAHDWGNDEDKKK